jgi:NAD(P)-dependent dehydrogenase (short-subunit alcohol dehydrogenase family)
MSSPQEKIVAVVGATGIQGGAVAKLLLNDGTYAVRALTRDVDSKKAQGLRGLHSVYGIPVLISLADLKALGAEVVAADAGDVDSLKKAFRGAWGVFGVTGVLTLQDVFVLTCTHGLIVFGSQTVSHTPASLSEIHFPFSYPLSIVWSLYGIHKGNQREAQAHEEQYGRNLVDAAEAEGIQHFVWRYVCSLLIVVSHPPPNPRHLPQYSAAH